MKQQKITSRQNNRRKVGNLEKKDRTWVRK